MTQLEHIIAGIEKNIADKKAVIESYRHNIMEQQNNMDDIIKNMEENQKTLEQLKTLLPERK